MVGAAAKPPAPPPPPGKPRPVPPAREEGESAPRRPSPPGLAIRILLSLLIVWHVSAVFLAPLSVPPSSQLIEGIAQHTAMQWYLDALYLNHGYYFFAPDPGPGHLVYYEVFDPQGRVTKQDHFPDWELHRPRLWYHRHFMLAEQVGGPVPEESWQRRYLEAYARQLLREFEGESVRVRWIAHAPPDPQNVTDPSKLDAPTSYRERMAPVVQRRSDLGAEARAQSAAPVEPQPEVANRWIGVTR